MNTTASQNNMHVTHTSLKKIFSTTHRYHLTFKMLKLTKVPSFHSSHQQYREATHYCQTEASEYKLICPSTQLTKLTEPRLDSCLLNVESFQILFLHLKWICIYCLLTYQHYPYQQYLGNSFLGVLILFCCCSLLVFFRLAY